jgi:hypothetical protein
MVISRDAEFDEASMLVFLEEEKHSSGGGSSRSQVVQVELDNVDNEINVQGASRSGSEVEQHHKPINQQIDTLHSDRIQLLLSGVQVHNIAPVGIRERLFVSV